MVTKQDILRLEARYMAACRVVQRAADRYSGKIKVKPRKRRARSVAETPMRETRPGFPPIPLLYGERQPAARQNSTRSRMLPIDYARRVLWYRMRRAEVVRQETLADLNLARKRLAEQERMAEEQRRRAAALDFNIEVAKAALGDFA